MLDIALVSYINTRPFVDGLEMGFSKEEASLHLLPPADCARALLDGSCNLALLPVGALADFPRVGLMPNYCIGANGAVGSVFIFSRRPIEELDTLILDRHSRSSNGLARILLQHYWQRPLPCVHPSGPHFDLIQGRTGGVVIGDKAIKIRQEFEYAYDLAEAWKYFSGLPFAFAVWAYRPGSLDLSQLQRLNEAMRLGVNQASKSAERWAAQFGMTQQFAREYLENYIDFRFDQGKHQALRLYLDALAALPELENTLA